MGQRSRAAPPPSLDPREVKRWGHRQGDVGSAGAALDDRSNLLDPQHLQWAGERRGSVKILSARLFGSHRSQERRLLAFQDLGEKNGCWRGGEERGKKPHGVKETLQ